MAEKRSNMPSVTVLMIAAAALASTGCELLPGLLGGGGGGGPDDPALTSAPLEVRVLAAEGTLNGQPIDTSTIDSFGVRNGLALDLSLDVLSAGAFITISTPGDAESSTQNPYAIDDDGTGGGDDLVDADRRRILPDASTPSPTSDLRVLVCGTTDCSAPDDTSLRIAATPDGRDAVFDAFWRGTNDRLHFDLHITEMR